MRARQLRRNQTDAEAVLWRRLRNRPLEGWKFRRQHPIGPFFADFACVELGLVVELDGGQHAEAESRDRARAALIDEHGFRTLRFWNHDVLNETEAVMESIRQVALALTPTLSRKREREQDKPLLAGCRGSKTDRSFG